MTSNAIEKASERVAKLQAQAEKLSAPLADAQAQLEAAQEAEVIRRTERGEIYDSEFSRTWSDRAREAASSGDGARDRFYELLAEEPWFVAYVEYRAARHKCRHVLDEAQRAQYALQEVVTVPEQRYYPVAILTDIESHVEKMAAEKAAEFADELRKSRDEFLNSKD
ncbi:hypothetical protein ACFXPV_29945 [Streptomyces sp. NPDC059118]|uniref:hypothetical protein n=1 Tax=unclassified Streptomyces TaxID=2593676 RepID=UPI00369D1201